MTTQDFIRGTDCSKSIFLRAKRPELLAPIQNKFERKPRALDYAKILYGNGVDISAKSHSIQESIKLTQDSLRQGEYLTYNAAFSGIDSFNCIIDLMILSDNKIQFIDVLERTSIKVPDNIYQIGLKWKTLCYNGFQRAEYYFLYPNPEYHLMEELDLEELFVLEKVTPRAKSNLHLVNHYLTIFDSERASSHPPNVLIGNHCDARFPCEFKSYCWRNVSDDSITHLKGLKNRIRYFQGQEIHSVADIPRDTNLSPQQWQEVDALSLKKISINNRKLKAFINELDLNTPKYYLNVTYAKILIPKFRNTKCNEQIPFQYTLLYQPSYGEAFTLKEEIIDFNFDPREKFYKTFLRDTKKDISILVYDSVLLIKLLIIGKVLFPKLSEELAERISRIQEINKPIRERFYYHHSFKGNASLSNVYSVMCLEASQAVNLKYNYADIDNYIYSDELDTLGKIKCERKISDVSKNLAIATLNITNTYNLLIDKN